MHSDTPYIPTYKGGENTIDGIFASSSLIVGNSGWLAFGENIGDYHVLWWDIPQTTLPRESVCFGDLVIAGVIGECVC